MAKVKSRHNLADYLHKKRLAQWEIAERVGMSQGSISTMLRSKNRIVTVVEFSDGEIELHERKLVERVVATSRG